MTLSTFSGRRPIIVISARRSQALQFFSELGMNERHVLLVHVTPLDHTEDQRLNGYAGGTPAFFLVDTLPNRILSTRENRTTNLLRDSCIARGYQLLDFNLDALPQGVR